MTIRYCAWVRHGLTDDNRDVPMQYRGELGRVRTKAHKKMLQLWARMAADAQYDSQELDIVRRCYVQLDNWGATVRWPSGRTTGISYYIVVD